MVAMLPAIVAALTQVLKGLFGTDKPLKEANAEIKTKPLDDERLAVAERLHGLR